MFTSGVSLYRTDYLTEEDLRSYRLAPIDKEDVSPPYAALSLAMAKAPIAKVALSGLSAGAVSPAIIPSSSTVVPSQVSSEAAPQGTGLRRKRTAVPRLYKALRVGVDDALGYVAVGTAAT